MWTVFYPYFEWCAKWSHPLHHAVYLLALSLFIQINVTLLSFVIMEMDKSCIHVFYGRMVLYRAGFFPLFIQMYIFMLIVYSTESTTA